uniref:protein SMG5-like n=1 Tax=Ciona intestinalis TaxID=7719 RepID=UPI00006A5031|nr:protein SMG5-like [Ciona intestinalis]|eukprot:XP_002122527.1 protein SMG5-like [Ciona intestinalis]
MSHTDDYSAKHTVSPEVKSISAKRLYRRVVECVRKLDLGRQHRRSLISLFHPEQVKLRHKLREACERLMFTYSSDYGRKAEELLWRKVYYDVIHAVKSGRKFQSNAPGALQQHHLQPHFRQFLYSAVGYYHYLLLRLQSKVKTDLVCIDLPLADKPLQRTTRRKNEEDAKTQDTEEKEIELWVKATSYKILVCLGDLSRYQMEFGGLKSRPNRFYQLALLTKPGMGMPHNQLATLAGHQSWWGLTATYHYCRSLYAEQSFGGAEGNLQKLLDRNKKLFYQLPTDALDGIVSTKVYRKEHTRIFIISFLYLCDLLRPKTYSTDVEISGLCKRLIDALHVCLNNMNLETDFIEEDLFEALPNGDIGQGLGSSKQKSGDNRHSNKSGTSVNVVAKAADHRKQQNLQHRLNGDIVFKICVLCLMNVHDLQACRSNRSSAAIAFALAFFSHVLGHVCQQITSDIKETEKQKSENLPNGCTDTQADGDHWSAAPKSKKNKSRMLTRRRRRVSGAEDGNLSEGEDSIAAGDHASDSDPIDSSSEDDSSYTSSSGSGTRLSQEDLSSQDEEDQFKTDENKVRGRSEKIEVQPPQPTLAVASLQDLSNKMFQPTNRHKITLAPSFLQHLTPATPAIKPTPPVEVTQPKINEIINEEIKVETGSNDIQDDSITDKPEVMDSNEGFRILQVMSQYHCLTSVLKLLADWLSANEGVVGACAKSSRALWNRLVQLVEVLPTEKLMLQIDELQNDKISNNFLMQVIDTSSPTESKPVENGKTDETEPARKEKAPYPKPSPWRQTIPLPEDYVIAKMNAIKDPSSKSFIDTTLPYQSLTNLQQCMIRTCRLRHLCRTLASMDDVEVDVINSDVTIGDEHFAAPEEETVDPQMELEAVEAMRKARMMKDMAASRLRNEVQLLETSLGAPKSRDSALCLYLVVDTSSMSLELPHIRRLVASGRFLVVIPKTVIDGLDAIKKESQGARDAIRYLESELKKGNRFIRAQSKDEQVPGVDGEPPKLRRDDVDAWRFYRIVECCRFLIQAEARKSGTEEKDHGDLVTILTCSREQPTPRKSTAIAAAKAHGIQVKSATVFSKSRAKASNHPQH